MTDQLPNRNDQERQNYAEMRQHYGLGELLEKDVDSDPLVQFERWFAEASQSDGMPDWFEPNAMTLATSGPDGSVTSRIILLKGVEQGKFLFFTNYHSAKGHQIAANPNVSLCFHWPQLQRQVRINGVASQVDRDRSLEYFHSRPRSSQLGAHVSEQSRVVAGRDQLESKMRELMETYPEGATIPLPNDWGGYQVEPTRLEFWQGRPSRLHDRIVYLRQHDTWTITRLAP